MLIERLELLSYLGNKWVVERLSNSKTIEISEQSTLKPSPLSWLNILQEITPEYVT